MREQGKQQQNRAANITNNNSSENYNTIAWMS